MNENPIIVALDVDSADEARALIKALGAAVSFYKVGMELYAAAGIDYVRELIDAGKDVFLDMKFYDIGETVKRAVKIVARTGARFLTIHGTNEVMQAAVEGRGESQLKLLAVTVLTSFDRDDIASLGYPCELAELVDLRAKNAIEAGVDGLVASPLDAARLRARIGNHPVLVTPGVRSAGADRGDQKRVSTPEQAIRDGANYVVMGRQITRAADPAAEARRVLAAMA